MKKTLAFVFVCLVSCLFSIGGFSTRAFATEEQTKNYLIVASYQQNTSNYGILNSEIKTTSTPFDYNTLKMMEGQSISPQTTTENQFTKQITINKTTLDNSMSMYVYVYFSEETAHNLTIKLLGETEETSVWTMDSQTLMSQIVSTSQYRNTRYGWMLVELPLSVTGVENITATHMEVEYTSSEINDAYNYAQLSFYAPYVASSKNSAITFSQKQNFYNFSVNYGENFNSYFAGDFFTVNNWNDLFDYCIIGEIDLLKYSTNLYKFKLQIIDQDYNIMESVMFDDGSFSVALVDEGSYTFRVTLYDSNDNMLYKAPDQVTIVEEFVALYLQNGIADMKEDTTSSYTIYTGDKVTSSNNLIATSSDTSIAEVSIENGDLVIYAKQAGKATITISVNATRPNADYQTYSYNYTLEVEEINTTNWIAIIFGAIGLIIAGIIVYTIMVRRRLIAGKYPKY